MIERPRHSFEEIREVIPEWWNDNGNSDPLKKIAWWVYSKETKKLLEIFPFVHDWGYRYGRLMGAPLDTWHWDQNEWDRLVYWYLKDHGKWMAARNQYTGLRIGGWRAWRNNAKMMARMGDDTYGDYVARKTEEGSLGEVGVIKPVEMN